MPSGRWFNYRRLVGGTRVLLTEASPWRLLLQSRVRDRVGDLVGTVSSWDAVETRPHQYGGTEFAVGGREVGHVHDWGLLDAPLARPLRDALVGTGGAAAHHIVPDSGWITTVVETDADVEHGRRLLRLSYLWHAAMYDPAGVTTTPAAIDEAVRALGFDGRVVDAFERGLAGRTAADDWWADASGGA